MRFAILISFVALTAQLLPAEDIVLVDGRYLHVKIQEVNEKGMKVQLLDQGGGQIFISWPLIIESQRKEIRRRYKLEEDEEAKVLVEDGNRITTKSGDVWEGRVVNETDKELTIKHQGSNMTIPKTAVKENEKTPVNVLSIYSSEEYYNKRAAELKVPDDDIPGNMELGDLANNLGLYEKSYAHYKKVQAADPGYQPDLIGNILKRLEELSKHKQIRDALYEAKKQTYYKQFVKAVTQFDAILAIKDLPATLKAEAELLKQKTIKARWEHYRLEVRKDYEATLRNKIRTWSRDDKLKLDDARRKLRSDLHKEVVAAVAERHGLDGKAEVEKMWEERGFHQPRTASYGSGSFIVLGRAPDAEKYDAEMQKYLQNVLRQQQGSRNNQNASLSAAPDKLPKPPTKEEWWSKVSTSSDREQWMLAFWADNAKKMTVVGERKEDCSRCGATGALSFSGSQGDTLRTTCPSCQGHKYYKGVAFK
jgi:hypothetical protein